MFTVSCGYLAKLICACTVLYHLSTDQCPCLKLASKSNLALISFVCGLQNSSNFCQMTSRVVSSGNKSQDITWSIPKSPDQATTFLHFCASESISNSQSSMFSHFIFHLRNQLYKSSSTVQFIFRTFYVRYICSCDRLVLSYEHFMAHCLTFVQSLSLLAHCLTLVQNLSLLLEGQYHLCVVHTAAFLFALGILVLLYFLALCSGSLSISGFWWVFHTMTSHVYLYSSTCSAQEYFSLAVFTAVSITSYVLAWPLRFHAFLLFTSIGYLVCLLGTIYYSCTGLSTIHLEQYLLWVI